MLRRGIPDDYINTDGIEPEEIPERLRKMAEILMAALNEDPPQSKYSKMLLAGCCATSSISCLGMEPAMKRDLVFDGGSNGTIQALESPVLKLPMFINKHNRTHDRRISIIQMPDPRPDAPIAKSP
jgi:hypothetical protein